MKNLSLKVACLLAAVVIWILVAGTTIVEADVGLPLEIDGLANGLTAAGSAVPDSQDSVGQVCSRVRALGRRMPPCRSPGCSRRNWG